MRNPVGIAAVLTLAALIASAEADDPQLPSTAEAWKIERMTLSAPLVSPSSLAIGSDDIVFVGQNPSVATAEPNASVLRLSKGSSTVFIDKLESVNGLECLGDVLYVVHPPYLSAFRDLDGDGQAENRVDLMTGLGAISPIGGVDDHTAGAIRRGMDGFLYIAIGDKGVYRGVGKDGATIRMQGGGVVRIRPDGSGLEVVSTGDDRTTGLALSAADDVFTFGGGDDGKRWAKSLVHQISGGHYGYPYQFVTSAFRALPVMSRLGDGAAGQGISYDEDGLPEAFHGNLFFCDPDAQTVFRHEIRKAGGSFSLAKRTPLVTKGQVADFRPYALATHDGGGFWLVDQASSVTGDPSRTGRLYRLSYTGDDLRPSTARPQGDALATWIKALDHPARSVRLKAQDRLAASGASSIQPLSDRLHGPEPVAGRIHALWALDRLATKEARLAIRSVLLDSSPQVRLQAARSCGIRVDGEARDPLIQLVNDRDPAVRREAAIALGRLADRSALPSLLAALGDADRFAAWSIRRAIHRIGCDDEAALAAALQDARRREAALLLADESWSIPIVKALVEALGKTSEPAVRGRMLACLAGQYRRYPEWTGEWFGPDPLAGPLPKKSEAWSPVGMTAVLRGLGAGLKDADVSVRYQAIFGLQMVGAPAASFLREALPAEQDVGNQAALVEALGALNDATSTRLLLPVLVDPERAEPVRSAALDSLNQLRGRDVVRARLTVLYDEKAPDSLVAKALPALARDGFLPANDIAGFLENASPLVRAAAVVSFNPTRPLPPEVKEIVLARLDDEDADVRRAALLAAGPLKLQEAVPRLIEKAKTAENEDRTSLLHTLCALPDPRALPLYIAAVGDADPSLNRAGVRALLSIRDRSEAEIRRIARQGGLSADAALALDRVLARFESVRDWRVLGPLPRQTPGLVARDGSIDGSRSYPGARGGTVAWRRLEPKGDSGAVDLLPLLGGPSQPSPVAQSISLDAAAYAEIQSATDRRAIVLIRSTGPFDLIVNGSPVSADPKYRDGRDYFAVPLVRGTNRILVASRQGEGGWEFVLLVSANDEESAGSISRPK